MRLSTGAIVYKDGSIYKPETYAVRGSWAYKPPSAMQEDPTDRKITFGRGREGREAAKAHAVSKITAVLASHEWEVPERIEEPMSMSGIGGLGYRWSAHPFGNVIFLLKRTMAGRFEVELSYHPLAEMLLRKNVPDRFVFDRVYTERISIEGSNTEVIEQWMKDPIQLISDRLTTKSLSMLSVPADLGVPKGVQLARIWKDTDLGFEVVDYDNLRHFVMAEAQQDLIKSLPSLELLLSALRAWGVEVDTWRRWQDGQSLRQIRFVVREAMEGKALEHRHTIEIGENGINIECGFIQDEQRFLDWQRIKATEFLNGLVNEGGE